MGAPASVAPPLKWPRANSIAWPLGTILLLLAAQFALIFTRAINWDEFFFYGQVAQFAQGELRAPLQTIHVHAFRWLTALPGNAVDHIITARLAMFGFECVTLACIFILSRRFSDTITALLAALCYISAGFVLQHGMSFRVDPPVTACLMGALCLLACAPLRWWAIAAFAFLLGLGGMITIKAVLFAPAFGGIAWLRWNDAGRAVSAAAKIAAAALASLFVFGILYWWHAASLSQDVMASAPAGKASALAAASTSIQAEKIVSRSIGDMFFIGMPPYSAMIVKAASLAPLLAALILAAPFAISRAKLTRTEKWALAGLWLPVITLAFYRNTAGYYYAFLFAPLSVSVVPGISWLRRRFGTMLVLLVPLITALPVWLKDDRSVLANQRQAIAAVERMFPQPVAYFDHSGMLTGYQKANGFMTPWGIEQYRAIGVDSYRHAMQRRVIPLFIDNDIIVETALEDPDQQILLPGDAQAVRDNYLPFWGKLWLAGKQVPAKSMRKEEFLVPGAYRLEGGSIEFDGRTIKAGDRVEALRGTHVLVNSGPQPARLVWNDIASAPTGPAPVGNLWIGY